MKAEDVFHKIEGQRDEMAQTLMELIRIPAVAPENGGEGELKKAEKLMAILREMGFDIILRYDAEDDRVPSKKRPNIVAYYEGDQVGEKLWLVTHLDVVPPGEESLWTTTKPYHLNPCSGKEGFMDGVAKIMGNRWWRLFLQSKS